MEWNGRPNRSGFPVVLTRDEVQKIFAHPRGTPRLLAALLYGSGLRLMARKSFAHVPGSAKDFVCSMFMC
jgi:hypothetical protein